METRGKTVSGDGPTMSGHLFEVKNKVFEVQRGSREVVFVIDWDLIRGTWRG